DQRRRSRRIRWPIPRRKRSPVAVADARKALRNLHRLSLVIHDPDDDARSVQMHAIAQRAAFEELPEAQRRTLLRSAADAILEAWPYVQRRARFAEALRANVNVLAAHPYDALWEPNCHMVLFRAGQSLGAAGLVGEAASYFASLTRTLRQRSGPEHVD